MAKLFYGNSSMSSSGIKAVDSLPTANQENYDKHELYLNDGELHYLDKKINDTAPTITTLSTQVSTSDALCSYAFINNICYYLIGNGVYKFDAESSTITSMSTYDLGSGASYNGQSCIDGDYIYFFKGYSYFLKYNNKENTGTRIAGSDYSGFISENSGQTIYNGYLYTFGGSGSSENIGAIYKFNLANNMSKTKLQSVITNGYACLVYRYNDIVYIFQYPDNYQRLYYKIWKFDLTTETLTETQLAIPQNLIQPTIVPFNNKCYIISGDTEFSYQTTNSRNIYIFDAESETFTTLTNALSFGCSGAGALVTDNIIYIIQGRLRQGYSDFSRYIRKMEFPEVIEYKQIASEEVS